MRAGKVYVIGDIHGCAEELGVLLDELAPRSTDTVVCLGDYIDRGPDAKAVIERLLALQMSGPRCVFLKGNHEDMFLAYAGQHGHFGDAFRFNGGDATLESYGLGDLSGAELWEALPPEHRAFFQSLQLTFRWQDFLCVHAGLDPRRPLGDQDEEDLLWIRHEWIQPPHPFGCTVIFGHTPMRQPFLQWPYKIGIDTGLVYGNRLTCLVLPELEFVQVPRGGTRATRWLPPESWRDPA
jgi:serine/threonine protein phosphatase 1